MTTDPSKLKEQARKFLGTKAFNYVAGGAGESATMDANRLAFRQWKVSFASLAQRLVVLDEREPDDPSNATEYYPP